MSLLGTNAVLIESDQVYDPQAGWQVQEVWAGSDSALSALSTTFAALGCRVSYSNVGGRKTLHVTIATVEPGGGAEVPSDSFTIHKTFVQVPLWQAPGTLALIKQFMKAEGLASTYETKEDVIAFWVGEMETAFAGKWFDTTSNEFVQVFRGPWRPSDLAGSASITYGSGTITGPAWPASMLKIYRLMLQMGSTHGGYEIERPSLQRLRTYSAAYSQRAKLDLVPKVYSTASLISLFNIPPLIQSQLPADPDNDYLPSNTAWGWKVRSDSTDIRWGGKFEERKEWVFWAWSTLLYDMV